MSGRQPITISCMARAGPKKSRPAWRLTSLRLLVMVLLAANGPWPFAASAPIGQGFRSPSPTTCVTSLCRGSAGFGFLDGPANLGSPFSLRKGVHDFFRGVPQARALRVDTMTVPRSASRLTARKAPLMLATDVAALVQVPPPADRRCNRSASGWQSWIPATTDLGLCQQEDKMGGVLLSSLKEQKDLEKATNQAISGVGANWKLPGMLVGQDMGLF